MAGCAVLLAPGAALHASEADRAIRDLVRFEQNIGAQLPLDTSWRDTENRPVLLRDAISERPAVLMFGYFNCPQLCGVTLDGVFAMLRQIKPTIGRDYDFVYISIDPEDSLFAARQAEALRIHRYGRGDNRAGWHFLRGDRTTIVGITDAAAFRFAPVPGARQFAHAAGFIVVRPDGVVSSYFPGLDFRPADVAAALRTAREGGNGSPVYDLLLLCFSGGGRSGAALWAFRSIQAAAGLTVCVLGFGIVYLVLHDKRTRDRSTEESQS
ncbi:MAG: SCO family protein [Opitutaceae bacterium]